VQCKICGATQSDSSAESALVPSNVRAHRSEHFPVWRCGACASIHAGTDVDLGHYYSQYPFHRQRYDGMLALFYRRQVRRLRRLGLNAKSTILDYGCGSGLFVHHLRSSGYERAAGFDQFSPEFSNRAVLARKYDFVVSQDVLEHSLDPMGMLAELGTLAQPDGTIIIGTPNAAAVDLRRAGYFRHTLHQPYHRHIFSVQALLAAGARAGWKVAAYYKRMYSNTLFPGMNQRFGMYYARLFDDTIDLAFDRPRFHWRLLTPWALALAFVGHLLSYDLDVAVAFRVGVR
jgi:SAM-dependent methyltransferase